MPSPTHPLPLSSLVEPRPDTGLNKAQLGMWLFLAAEGMLFSILFATYLELRIDSVRWPQGALSDAAGLLLTFLLLGSNLSFVMARRALCAGNSGRFKLTIGGTLLFATLFVAIQGFQFYSLLTHSMGPWHSSFLAIYYVLATLFTLHLMVGMGVLSSYWMLSDRQRQTNPQQFRNRIAQTGLYWNFLSFLWLILFTILYLF